MKRLVAEPVADPPAQSPRTGRGGLHGHAVTALRDMITGGKLPAGRRLRERELCDQLGVSRTPLREAIRSLASEGLVQITPNRGAVVSDLDLAEVGALYQVLETLESLAARLAGARFSDEDIATLGALHYQMVWHHLRGDLDAYFALNQKIHRRIVEVSENPVLLWVWDILAPRVKRARYTTNQDPERWAEAVREHEAIFKAIAARDEKQLEELIRAHLNRGFATIRGRADASEPGAVPAS